MRLCSLGDFSVTVVKMFSKEIISINTKCRKQILEFI